MKTYSDVIVAARAVALKREAEECGANEVSLGNSDRPVDVYIVRVGTRVTRRCQVAAGATDFTAVHCKEIAAQKNDFSFVKCSEMTSRTEEVPHADSSTRCRSIAGEVELQPAG